MITVFKYDILVSISNLCKKKKKKSSYIPNIDNLNRYKMPYNSLMFTITKLTVV